MPAQVARLHEAPAASRAAAAVSAAFLWLLWTLELLVKSLLCQDLMLALACLMLMLMQYIDA